MKPPKVAWIGAGRHGSGWTAEVLRRAGVNAAHEGHWTPFGPQYSDLDVDSSWIATVLLGDFEGKVVHQVRHPLRYVASVVHAPEQAEYAGLKLATVGRWIPDPNERALTEWLIFNTRAMQLANTGLDSLRVESLSTVEVVRIAAILLERDDLDYDAAEKTPTDWNDHGGRLYPVQWEDMPQCQALNEARALAEQLGYFE